MKHHFLSFSLLLLFMSATPPITLLSEVDETNSYQLYFLAHFNHLNNNNKTAQHYYELLLKENPPTAVYEGFAHHLFQTEQYAQLIQLIPQLEKVVPHNLDTQLLCAQALELAGKSNEAREKLIALSQQFPLNPEVVYYAATATAHNNQPEQALKLIDVYLSQTPEHLKQFIFYFLKAQIYATLGNSNLALENVKKSLELNKQFDQGWLFLGLMHELSGDLDQAIKGYEQCLSIMGTNDLLERQIIALQLKKQQKNRLDSLQDNFKKALDLFNQAKYREALANLDEILKKSKHLSSRLLKIEILCRTGKVPQAVSLLEDWAQEDEYNDTWYRALHLLHHAGASTQIILKAYLTLEKEFHKNYLPKLYLADIYLKTKNNNQAEQYLKNALALIKEPKIYTKTVFQLALLYYQEQNWQEFDRIVQEVQKASYDFPPLFNLLAYYQATHTKNLDQAQQNITKALSKDPNNPHFLDTQAFIWYKKKEYKKAYETFSTIAQHVSHDSCIAYHVAKAAYHLGNMASAKESLQKAIAYSTNAHDKELYKKYLDKWQ